MSIGIKGAGWITVSGRGMSNSAELFDMPDGELPRLAREDFFDHPDQRFGRLDRYSKLGVAAFSLAMKDAGLDNNDRRSSIGAMASTDSGSFDADREYFQTVIQQDGLLCSPNLFAYTLPNCMLGEVSIRFGIAGPCIVMEKSDESRLSGIIAGMEMLDYGLCEIVVAGFCDAGRGPLLSDTAGRPAAVFVVMEDNGQSAGLTCDGDVVFFNGRLQPDITVLMNNIIKNRRQVAKK